VTLINVIMDIISWVLGVFNRKDVSSNWARGVDAKSKYIVYKSY
jgi:hypothetical protein